MPTAIVRRFVEALERQDLDAAIRCLDRGVYFVSTGEAADFSAHEGFCRWWEQQISNGSVFRPLQVEALDDRRVFAELLSGYPGNAGHTWTAETKGWMFTVTDGVIDAIEMFTDAEAALQRARHTIVVCRQEGLLQDS